MGFMTPLQPGIYCIENTVTGERYVGQSLFLNERIDMHRRQIRRQAHPNKRIQAAVEKYGPDAFTISIIEETRDLDRREHYHILRLRPEYNQERMPGNPMAYISCAFPREVLDAIDQIGGLRQAFIREAVREKLERMGVSITSDE